MLTNLLLLTLVNKSIMSLIVATTQNLPIKKTSLQKTSQLKTSLLKTCPSTENLFLYLAVQNVALQVTSPYRDLASTKPLQKCCLYRVNHSGRGDITVLHAGLKTHMGIKTLNRSPATVVSGPIWTN